MLVQVRLGITHHKYCLSSHWHHHCPCRCQDCRFILSHYQKHQGRCRYVKNCWFVQLELFPRGESGLDYCSWSKSTEHHHCPTLSLLSYHNLAVDKLDCSPRIVSGAETGLDDALPMAEHVKLRQWHVGRHLNLLLITMTSKDNQDIDNNQYNVKLRQ